MKLLLDCRTLTKLLSQSQDDDLPLTVRSRMRLHLVSCEACRNLDEQLRFLRSVLSELKADRSATRKPGGPHLH
jgi:predicted anti-sigma-YlaC factor YlaD